MNGDFPKQARALVAQLEVSAYDIRIPRMVASYFNDMRAVFGALKKHLTAQATLILDIGDSAYGNIHVPTDKLLAEIFLQTDVSRRLWAAPGLACFRSAQGASATDA